MQIDIAIFLSALTAASLCAVLMPWMSIIARRIDLVDKPDQRKQHQGDVPIIGGLCIYLAAFVAVGTVNFSLSALIPLIVGAGLVFLGVIDDRTGLSTLIRFPAHVATALIMISIGNIGIESVGNLFGFGPVIMGSTASIIFTVMCTVGVINSINMIDGVDGLSGSIILITLLTLTYFNYLAGDASSVILMVALISATAVFLLFNSRLFRSRAAVFMGDAGSTLFGFLLVWYFIRLTQGEDAVLSPVAAGWIFGLPLMDTIAVMVGRMLRKKSPFQADRNHLHHHLLDAKLSPNQVVLTMIVIHLVLVIGGLICNAYPKFEPGFFWLFVGIVVLHYFVTPRVLGTKKTKLRASVAGRNASNNL